jgi:hypothetical protein
MIGKGEHMPDGGGFTLNIYFEGLCGFVPFSRGSDFNSMWVLMPDRTQAPQSANQPPVHTPALVCDMADLQPPVAIAQGLYFLNLSGFDLRILPGGQPVASDSLVFQAYDPVHDRNIGTGNDFNTSFDWVAPVHKAASGVGYDGGGVVRQELFHDPLQTGKDVLGARLFANFGTVSSARLGAGSQAPGTAVQYIIWRFRAFRGAAAKGNLATRLASQILLSMPIAASFVELRATNWNDSSVVSVKLAPAGGDDKVEISIVNEESDAILGTKENPAPFECGGARVKDRIFEAFFDLTANVQISAEERPMPVPSLLEPLTSAAVTNPTAVSPPCSPARFPATGVSS